MVVCAECGAENRDRARFCRGCVRPLVAATIVEAPELDPSSYGGSAGQSIRTCPACQAPNPRRAMACLACGTSFGRRRKAFVSAQKDKVQDPAEDSPKAVPPRSRWIAWIGFSLLLGASAFWWFSAPSIDSAALRRPSPGLESGLQPIDGATVPGTTAPVDTRAIEPVSVWEDPPAGAQLMEAVEQIREREERKAAERIVAKDLASAARIAKQKRLQEARLLAAKKADSALPTVVTPPAPASAPAPAPLAPAPRAPMSVEQTCASNTNFIARDLCRVDACRKPINASDPICVWYRQLEAERRGRLAN
jgi:hypothetical protein